MSRESANPSYREIRTLFALGTLGGLTDGQLVERFLGRDGPDREDAFAALVRRHGPMVLGVCRRMLGASADAEDAFQAVFLVLARRAGAVRRVEGLKPWLYGVAVRTAKEARRRSARRRAREGGTMDESRAVAAPDEGRCDLMDLLDEELDRLPGRYRDPLMLCELEGVSRRDAARRLGLPEGTVSSRLSRGRSLLRDRLERRGVTLGTGIFAASLSEPASAALPEPLAEATVRLALKSGAGGATSGAEAAEVLARAVGRTVSPWGKLVSAAVATVSASRALLPTAALAGCVLAAALAGWVVASGGANPVEPAPPEQVANVAPVPVPNPVADDPLPMGATMRFGTSRFRHTTTIESLAVSPDGTVAVAASGTRALATVRAYDLTTGRVRFAFDRSATDVEAVAFSPDGKTLATTTVAVTTSPAVYLYDMANGKEIARIPYPVANPGSTSDLILFAPDGKHVVIKAADGKALLRIDLARREVVRTYPTAGTVFAAALSPNGKRLVAGGFDYEKGERTTRQWEVDSGRELGPIPLRKGTVRSAAFSPDGATIALGIEARDLIVMLVDAATGEERAEIPFPGAAKIRSIAFSPDGKTLAASGGSSTRLFDVGTGQERLVIDRNAIGLRFPPDGATLVGAVAGTLYRWDATTGRSLIPEGGESPVVQIAVTADGKRIVTRGQDGDGHIWEARTGEHQRRVNMSWQRGFALSPDGRFLVWPVADEAIQFRDADRPDISYFGSQLRMIDVADGSPIERFGGFEGDAHDLFFSADGKTLVTADRYRRDAGVRLWDVATGRVERSFSAAGEPGSRVWRSRLSPDGKALAVQYQGPMRGLNLPSSVKLWDIATGKEIVGAPGHWFDDEIMAMGTDGKTAATSAPDGTIRLRDASTWHVRGEISGPRDRVTALAFGPDGRLFSGSGDATVLAWDPASAIRPPADRR